MPNSMKEWNDGEYADFDSKFEAEFVIRLALKSKLIASNPQTTFIIRFIALGHLT